MTLCQAVPVVIELTVTNTKAEGNDVILAHKVYGIKVTVNIVTKIYDLIAQTICVLLHQHIS